MGRCQQGKQRSWGAGGIEEERIKSSLHKLREVGLGHTGALLRRTERGNGQIQAYM